MKKHLLYIITIILLIGMVAGCAAPAPTATPTAAPAAEEPAAEEPVAEEPAAEEPEPAAEEPAASGPKVLRINIGTWPDTLDPQVESFVNEIAITQMLYEGLVRLNEKSEVMPGAAEKWESSEDGKSMTFHLRSGLKRADGTPITAKDFEWAYKRLVDPRTQGQYNGLIDDVVGAVEARSMDLEASSDEEIDAAVEKVGVKATDDSTLVFEFNNPVGYFAYIASTWVGWPTDPKSVEQDPEAWWANPDLHNGNGPWKIEGWEDNKLISFVPNENYWGEKPKLDRIEFYFITEHAVAFEAYKKGELDIIAAAPEDIAAIEADPTLASELFKGAGSCTFYVGFHNQKPPFDNKEVRRAFAMALDRERWVNDVWAGQGKPALSFIPDGIPGQDPTAVQEEGDPKAALKALIDAGYGAADSTEEKPKCDCEKLGEIKLTYGASAANHLRFQALAGMFTSAFNCPITLDPVDPTVYTALMKDIKTTPQFFHLGWCSDYPHPQNWLFVWRTGDLIAGRIGYENPALDELIAKANSEPDLEKALPMYQEAQKMVLADYPAAMLMNDENWYLVKSYVKGAVDSYSPSDSAWPGQYGPIATYDIDLSAVGEGYPTE